MPDRRRSRDGGQEGGNPRGQSRTEHAATGPYGLRVIKILLELLGKRAGNLAAVAKAQDLYEFLQSHFSTEDANTILGGLKVLVPVMTNFTWFTDLIAGAFRLDRDLAGEVFKEGMDHAILTFFEEAQAMRDKPANVQEQMLRHDAERAISEMDRIVRTRPPLTALQAIAKLLPEEHRRFEELLAKSPKRDEMVRRLFIVRCSVADLRGALAFANRDDAVRVLEGLLAKPEKTGLAAAAAKLEKKFADIGAEMVENPQFTKHLEVSIEASKGARMRRRLWFGPKKKEKLLFTIMEFWRKLFGRQRKDERA